MKEFIYNGIPLHKLESIYEIKDLDKQIEEIEARLEAMLEFCKTNKATFSPLHMKNALAISSKTFQRYTRGVVIDKNKKAIPVETSDLTKHDREAIRKRSDLLKAWRDYGQMWCIDDISATSSSGNIYLGKALYHMWDKPQEKQENKIGVELLIKEAAKK